MSARVQVQELVSRIRTGDVRALARGLTLVESAAAEAGPLLAATYSMTGGALVLGVTGATGVGKSTLVGRVAGLYRSRERRVGIVAVDPSSPFTGGALLGDRLRMSQHFTDPGVFIRSMATRGQLGGLAAATASCVDLLDAAGYDVILVETVGAGQEDVDVARLAAITTLVLTPNSGDDVQVLKAGVMEIGDLYVINKADLEGTQRLEASLLSQLEIAGVGERDIIKTVATEGEGLEELVAALERLRERFGREAHKERARGRAEARILAAVRARLDERLSRSALVEPLLEELTAAVAERRIHPDAAAEKLLKRSLEGGSR